MLSCPTIKPSANILRIDKGEAAVFWATVCQCVGLCQKRQAQLLHRLLQEHLEEHIHQHRRISVGKRSTWSRFRNHLFHPKERKGQSSWVLYIQKGYWSFSDPWLQLQHSTNTVVKGYDFMGRLTNWEIYSQKLEPLEGWPINRRNRKEVHFQLALPY